MTIRIAWKTLLIILGIVLYFGGATWVSAITLKQQASNTIFACVNNNNGTLRIVAEGTACENNSSPLSWSRGQSSGATGGGSVFGISGYTNEEGIDACFDLIGAGADCGPDRELPLTSNGKLVAFAVFPAQNTNQAGIATITVLVNGSPTALQVQIPPGSTATQIVRLNVPIQAGDRVMVRVTEPTAGPGYVAFRASLEYRID